MRRDPIVEVGAVALQHGRGSLDLSVSALEIGPCFVASRYPKEGRVGVTRSGLVMRVGGVPMNVRASFHRTQGTPVVALRPTRVQVEWLNRARGTHRRHGRGR